MMLKVLGMAHEQAVKGLIRDAFSAEPWCDRWEDKDVFHSYILDVMGNQNSLALGLFSEDVLIGISLGRLRHWYNGIEYCIDDLCIASEHQGQGFGSLWIQLIRNYACQHGFRNISLQTKRNAPAYHFYQKTGFEEQEDRVCFSLDCLP